MGEDTSTPSDLHADDGVVVGYPAERVPGSRLELGPGARLRRGTILYTGSVIGAGLQTGHNVVVRESCEIGDDVAVWSNSVIDYGCTLGDRVKIHANCYVSQFTEIEDDAFLAPGVSLANDLFPGNDESAEQMRGPVIRAGAQLGVNVTVLPYVEIGAGAIIGAGSVVTRDVPAGTVVRGEPARAHGPVPGPQDVRDRLRRRSGGS